MENIFTENIKSEIETVRSKFPKSQKKSAIIESLLILQHNNNGYLTEDIISELADYLDVQRIDVYEVATFYSMFSLNPVGKNARLNVLEVNQLEK